VDVTGLCVFEGADSGATVSPDGVVHRQAFGESVVLVRYLRDQVPIRVDFVRHGAREAWKAPIVCGATPSNAIDDFVLAKLRRLGVRSAEQASDSVLLRRLHLDLLGHAAGERGGKEFRVGPAADENRAARGSAAPAAGVLRALGAPMVRSLRNEERTLDAKGSQTFFDWIRRSFEESKPLDVFAREVIRAAAALIRARRPIITAQLAIRRRARSRRRRSFWACGFNARDATAIRSIVGRRTTTTAGRATSRASSTKCSRTAGRDRNDGHEFVGEQVVWFAPEGKVKDPRTDRPAPLRLLGTGQRDEAPESARLERLAAWVTSPSNPFFARAQANRIWASLLGRGIVEPMDDFRATNPPSHPELLDALAKELVASGYDVRSLVRRIVLSRTYQLAAALPDGELGENAPNDVRDAYFAHASIRRLTAEELLDAYTHVTGASAPARRLSGRDARRPAAGGRCGTGPRAPAQPERAIPHDVRQAPAAAYLRVRALGRHDVGAGFSAPERLVSR
jgi:broad specificity phosphatase PhoE